MKLHFKSHLPKRDFSICVAGAGAIGAALSFKLASKFEGVSVLARGETLRAIKANGITMVGENSASSVPVYAGEPSDLRVQDVIFLCSKAQDLPELAEAIQPLISHSTIIVPMTNGIPWWYFEGSPAAGDAPIEAVDPTGRLKKLLPSTNVVGAVNMIIAERIAPGMVQSLNPGRVIVGPVHSDIQPAETISLILNEAGIATSLAEPIRAAVWKKVVLNLVTNPLSVISGGNTTEFLTDPYLAAVCEGLFKEANAVAEIYGFEGCQFSEFERLGRSMKPFKTSMLHDFENGRPLELDPICGSVVELAERRGVEVPLIKQVMNLTRYKSAARSVRMAA
ncbi:2-dehydropantoate 2-reductase [Rhizobium leguminosarum]|uniref:ketopantoate reductase family protein n=1 Tax=Rhizobium ruizarguesonis TaxID=2081791 RepID=UPI00103EC7DC|nr:2-dehydropantoate 2-reductase [Rhizobium ruizarguesonis]NEI05368.1 2-dehydropantoate 2-reductase [Rhizobium ruizarguesonis]TCA20346.1 2-dehydropantoate 2-reductase [Rhizobium leguminosarum bv. viciae]